MPIFRTILFTPPRCSLLANESVYDLFYLKEIEPAMLTPQQSKLFGYLSSQSAQGYTPSFEEMMLAMGLKSKSGIHRLVQGLEERGYIRRLFNKARAIELLRPMNKPPNKLEGIVRQVPLYGSIAAGTPIEAISTVHDQISVPTSLIGAGEHYALTVRGDSMVDAGILDGDLALIEQTTDVRRGEIVVALIRKEEATLKFYEPSGKLVTLRPANTQYEAQTYTMKEVNIQGRLCAIWRRY